MTQRTTLANQIAYLSIALSAAPEGLRKSSRRSEAETIMAGANQALATLKEIAIDEGAHRALVLARRRSAT